MLTSLESLHFNTLTMLPLMTHSPLTNSMIYFPLELSGDDWDPVRIAIWCLCSCGSCCSRALDMLAQWNPLWEIPYLKTPPTSRLSNTGDIYDQRTTYIWAGQ